MIKKQLYFLGPELFWDADAIEAIASRALEYNPNTSLVDAAFSLTHLLVVKARVLSLPTLEKELNDLRAQIEGFQIDLLKNYDEKSGEQYRELQKRLKEKLNEYQEKQAQLACINKAELQFLKLKEQSYKLAVQATNQAGKKKWLENHVYSCLLLRKIEAQRVELGLPGRINKALIEQIIENEKATAKILSD